MIVEYFGLKIGFWEYGKYFIVFVEKLEFLLILDMLFNYDN